MHFFINNPLRNCDMKLQILTDDMYLRIFVFTDCIHNVDSKCRRSVKIFIFRSNNLQLTIVCNKAIVNLMKPIANVGSQSRFLSFVATIYNLQLFVTKLL
jgi:hypothetical protein